MILILLTSIVVTAIIGYVAYLLINRYLVERVISPKPHDDSSIGVDPSPIDKEKK